MTVAIFRNLRCGLKHLQALSCLRVVVWLIHVPKHGQFSHFFFEKTVITQIIEGCTLGVFEASQNKTMKVIFVDYISLSSFL